MAKIPVNIDSSRPIFIEADAASFGEVFARARSDEQAAILKAMCDKLEEYGTQHDYVAMELAQPEYAVTRERLRYLITWEEEAA